MLFHFSVLAFALLFFGFLEIIISFPRWFLVFALLFLGVLFRVSWRFGGSTTSAIVPTLFSFSVFLLLFFVSSTREKHIFIVLSTIIFYVGALGIYRLRHCRGDLTAHSMLSLVAMTTLFFLFSALFGVFLNFERFNELALMSSLGISAFLVSLSIFSRSLCDNRRRALFLALLLGLFVSQIAWIGVFWPFGYLTSGVICLIFTFLPWDMIQSEISGKFSKKRLFSLLILSLALIGMVLSSSEWLPMV